MALSEELRLQGRWLFRWRSYLPLVVLPIVVLAIFQANGTFETLVHEMSEGVGLVVSVIGLLIRVLTVGHTPAGTSGRNVRRQIAAQLNTSGMYSVVRHPLYLGNYLIGLGISTVLLVWWLPVIYSLLFWIYYERIMYTEEAYLRRKFGDDYLRWTEKTPAFLPRPMQWRPATLPFSWRHVVRREYSGLTTIVLAHCGLECSELLLQEHAIVWKVFWATTLFSGIAFYILIHLLKRRTSVLFVPGR